MKFALEHRPDLITSDVRLIEGTGPAAVSKIHERLGEAPMIFISGTPDECQPCNPPGVIVAKPFRKEELANASVR